MFTYTVWKRYYDEGVRDFCCVRNPIKAGSMLNAPIERASTKDLGSLYHKEGDCLEDIESIDTISGIRRNPNLRFTDYPAEDTDIREFEIGFKR